jgi:hypothetical protein
MYLRKIKCVQQQGGEGKNKSLNLVNAEFKRGTAGEGILLKRVEFINSQYVKEKILSFNLKNYN